MSFVASAVPALLAAGTGAVTSLISGSAPKINVPPPVQQDDAAATLAANDTIARRRGGASDILNGDAGFKQPLPAPKAVLGA